MCYFNKRLRKYTYNKLQVCINILKYIIKDSEKNGLIQIKSHFDLLKDCLIYKLKQILSENYNIKERI